MADAFGIGGIFQGIGNTFLAGSQAQKTRDDARTAAAAIKEEQYRLAGTDQQNILAYLLQTSNAQTSLIKIVLIISVAGMFVLLFIKKA